MLGQFTAIRSGEFNATSTWLGGIIPYGNGTVTISRNVQVTLERPMIELRIAAWYLYGVLIVGSQTLDSFTFRTVTNVVVYPGGGLIDRTSRGLIYVEVGTLLTKYPGGFIAGNGTSIVPAGGSQRSLSSSARQVIVSQQTTSLTVGVLRQDVIETYTEVTSIAYRSGSFGDASTWAGNALPPRDMCALSNTCGMSVSLSCALTTNGLDNVMSNPFSTLRIAASASIQLGVPGFATGFRFSASISMNCFGSTTHVASGDGCLYVVTSTSLNFFPGAIFQSTATSYLCVYNPLSGALIGERYLLPSFFRGPLYFSVRVDGYIAMSTRSKQNIFLTMHRHELLSSNCCSTWSRRCISYDSSSSQPAKYQPCQLTKLDIQ